MKKKNFQEKKKEENKTRCFISINIPKDTAERVKETQNKLPDFNGKKTGKENLHLTLKFLGELSPLEIKKVKEILREIKFKKFSLEAESLGVFSKKFIRIIWLHLMGAEELQKKIDKEISLNMENFGKERRFMSHLTIARVNSLPSGTDKERFLKELDSIKIPEISFPVKEFCLMSSELKSSGAEHNVIERFELY